MNKTKKVTITLKLDTINIFDDFSKKYSINKSGFIDKLINEAIKKHEKNK
jgi:metal-responsive CopG/Arc/MetJ family transcriptional regulator